MRYTGAVVQYEPRFGEKAHNLAQLLRLTEEAARAGARLVVLPEMAATGYCFRSREEIAPFVEPVPGGPTLEALGALAARWNLHVVVGLPEVEPATGVYYNTAALIGPKGFIGKYRKLHSYIDETRWARDGDLGMPVFETEIGRIAIQICMDADYFEPARLAAVAGADLIAFPTNWLGKESIWYARAAENGLYMLCANRWGEERGARFCGNSAIIDPEGRALNLLSTGDGICLADLDLERVHRRRDSLLALRRPALYQELLINSHLWHWKDAFDLPPGRPVVVATGRAAQPAAMADQARWADVQVRDKGHAALDLILFPSVAGQEEGAVEQMAAVARDLGCWIGWGDHGPAGDRAWLVGPDGMAGSYQAVHPAHGGPAGDRFATLDLPWGRVGLAAGLDLLLPETARILAKRGADLIIAPLARQVEPDPLLWSARWLENEAAILVAAPDGPCGICGSRPKAQPGHDGIWIGVVETGSERIRSKELLRKLQPYWYGPLVHPSQQ
ncbi:MAG: nitrilase-related carbon-nitrogen hydrolase [Bacillota bacterium]